MDQLVFFFHCFLNFVSYLGSHFRLRLVPLGTDLVHQLSVFPVIGLAKTFVTLFFDLLNDISSYLDEAGRMFKS